MNFTPNSDEAPQVSRHCSVRPPGCAVLVLAALDALQAKHPFPSADVRWDPKEILRLALKSLPAGTNSSAKPAPLAK